MLQNLGEAGNRAIIEVPFALLDEQVKMLLRDAVVAPKMAFGLVPEVLDAIDVVGLNGEPFGMINADVVKLRNIQDVIGGKASV